MAEVEIPHPEGKAGEKPIGILISIIAVAMAIVSALGHSAANEMIVDEVKSSNGFAWYQARRQRGFANELEIRHAEVALAGNPTEAQRELLNREFQELRAKNAGYLAENERTLAEARAYALEARTATLRNDGFDHAEILLQVAVVLCSLTLLTESRLFLRIGIVAAVIGAVFAGHTFMRRAEPPSEPQTHPAVHHDPSAR